MADNKKPTDDLLKAMENLLQQSLLLENRLW